ncbi:MAG: rhodanese-like domain-containing protein [Eubacteriales bacterium]|nr:rhodanese-like domain-containing protein [Eubacteriales bacterium]
MRKIKKITLIIITVATIFAFASCGNNQDSGYTQADAEQAKQMMEDEKDYVILDVRTDSEYNEGHIPGAILIPDYEINEKAESVLKDKDQLILVYCRSGNRSQGASETLVNLGYTNVVDFGGINNWTYEIER